MNTIADLKNNEYFKVFQEVGQIADKLGYECYVVGGFVRDFMLGKANHDLDFVVVGSGLEIAKAVGLHYNGKVSLYESYGTAKVDTKVGDLEFVGARKEFYHRESRNPIVEDGTLADDLARRDFTINDMAICVNADRFGELIDLSNGQADLKDKCIRCVGDANERFNEDPLRMLRAIRFATRFNFVPDLDVLSAIKNNASRIKIITQERITEEIHKMMLGAEPARAISLLNETGLLKYVLPEIDALKKNDVVNGVHHKDMFKHTLEVLAYVAQHSDDVWLRWAALFHDVGKPVVKKFEHSINLMVGKGRGQWTFINHAEVGAKMIQKIFKRMSLPMDERMKIVEDLVRYHMHPHNLCSTEVTDSAIRRLLFNLGDNIDALMILCNADITSGNAMKVKAFRDNYVYLVQRMKEVEEKDHIRNFQPPVDGNEIMEMFNLTPCRTVGILKEAVKNAILDGIIPNDHDEARQFVINTYNTMK